MFIWALRIHFSTAFNLFSPPNNRKYGREPVNFSMVNENVICRFVSYIYIGSMCMCDINLCYCITNEIKFVNSSSLTILNTT